MPRSALLRSITVGSSALIVLDHPVSDAQFSELMASIGPGNDLLITTCEQPPQWYDSASRSSRCRRWRRPTRRTSSYQNMGMDLGTLEDRSELDVLAQAVGNNPLSLEVLGGDLQLQPDRPDALSAGPRRAE
jgi:hypothetical protein